MEEIAISKFKAKCSALLERVRKTKTAIRITRNGVAVAEVIPSSSVQKRAAWLRSMKNSVEILGDVISPASEQGEWEVLRD